MSAKQLTIRNPSEELTCRLRELSAATGQSLNSTVLKLLEEALGITSRRSVLERYATWSEEEALEFESAIRTQRTIDEKLWT